MSSRTNQGRRVYVCATAQNSDLNQAGYEALTWVEVGSVGNLGETGNVQEFLNYDVWGTGTRQKAKGINDAGSPVLEVAQDYGDAGQDILRTFGDPNNNDNMAVQIEDNDIESGGSTNSKYYYRGRVVGPRHGQGAAEDFVVDRYTFGFNQAEVAVERT